MPPLDKPLTPPDNAKQDGHVELIDRRQLVPLNDVECPHERYEEDPSDETETYIAMVCANPRCPYGYLQAK